MRGYLINSERHTIEEIDFGPDLDDICRVLNCRKIANCSRSLRGNMTEGFDSIYASDDYLEDHPLFGFQVDTDRTPPSSFPVAGNGLVHGVDEEGHLCDIKITLDEVRARITFTRIKDGKDFSRVERTHRTLIAKWTRQERRELYDRLKKEFS
jgi:hypothetical protein